MEKKYFISLGLFLLGVFAYSQSYYKKWSKSTVTALYQRKEIQLDESKALDENGKEFKDRKIIYYVPKSKENGIYKVNITRKVGDNFYEAKLDRWGDEKLYIYFWYDPSLYGSSNKGILEVSSSYSIEFYREP